LPGCFRGFRTSGPNPFEIPSPTLWAPPNLFWFSGVIGSFFADLSHGLRVEIPQVLCDCKLGLEEVSVGTISAGRPKHVGHSRPDAGVNSNGTGRGTRCRSWRSRAEVV